MHGLWLSLYCKWEEGEARSSPRTRLPGDREKALSRAV